MPDSKFFSSSLRIDSRVRSFPIGPRDLFLVKDELMAESPVQSTLPWRLWGPRPSGSRTVAVSYFLRSLPLGFYGGKVLYGLAVGAIPPAPDAERLPRQRVIAISILSDFGKALLRVHPLVVDHAASAKALLGHESPVPVFETWPQALAFAQHQLSHPNDLDELQAHIQSWWHGHAKLSKVILLGFSCRSCYCSTKTFLDSFASSLRTSSVLVMSSLPFAHMIAR